jgi:hypothetical protein
MLEDRKFYFDVGQGSLDTIGSGARVLGIRRKVVVRRCRQDDIRIRCQVNTVRKSRFPDHRGNFRMNWPCSDKEYTCRVVLGGDKSAGLIQVSLVWAEGQAGRQTVTIKKLSKDYKARI